CRPRARGGAAPSSVRRHARLPPRPRPRQRPRSTRPSLRKSLSRLALPLAYSSVLCSSIGIHSAVGIGSCHGMRTTAYATAQYNVALRTRTGLKQRIAAPAGSSYALDTNRPLPLLPPDMERPLHGW